MKRTLLVHWIPLVSLLIVGYYIGQHFFAEMFHPYTIQIIGDRGELLADGQKVFYSDVNNDGNSEEFIYYHLSDNRQPVINQYSASGKFQNLWSLDGEVFENFEFIQGDYDGDLQKEIYVFALEKNKLFLYGIKPYESNEFIFDKVMVCSLENRENNRFMVVHPGGIYDMNNDGFGELVFSVNSRYSPSPRRVYSYDIKNNTLNQSKDIGMQLVGSPIVYDVDGDQFPEIFLSTLNSTTQAWVLPNEDALHSSALILNHRLEKKLESLKFKSRMSVTATYPWAGKKDVGIVALSWPLNHGEKGQLAILNDKGDTLAYKRIRNKTFVFDPKRDDWNNCLLFTHSGQVINVDNKLDFKIIADLKAKINHIEFINITGDESEELVVIMNNELAIFDSDLKHSTIVEFPGLGVEGVSLSLKTNVGKDNNLSLQSGNYQYLVSYKKNTNYHLRYLAYLVLGIVLAAIFYFSRRLYLYQIDRIKQSNKEVMELQIELMKNQLDPHFLFNALNSISYSINKNDRKTAYYNLGVFSKLMRESISSMDELNRTLEEEINYTTHYLLLEKFRFKEQFDYNFIVSPEISKSSMVPKMCLFCYVESALKKGVLPNEGGGTIEIKIDSNSNNQLLLSIRDNGLYRAVENQKDSISNSIVALNHIIGYYNSFNTDKIEIEYRDLGTESDAKGSVRTLAIPNQYNYSS